MIKDYVSCSSVDNMIINRYTKKIPESLMEIWMKCGLGSFWDGYIKIINPDDYIDLLKSSYFRGDVAIPIMVTAFGDIITWEKNKYVGIVEYRYGKSEIMISDFDLFLFLLNDSSFTDKFFQFNKYQEALRRYGKLAMDESFGYVPILALGGKENVDNIKKVKTKEHIALITDLIGLI
ncbi:MAG: DUF1851 domain-containing protein [Ruminococcus flavefaciens]|nr:DUF1851 domain-containing protein [Ruminococcus flavefaciens]MCM1361027.1 DUF1851 domain-containing protein [Clostridiales bacterium]